MPYTIIHHGAKDGVTGSCHELRLNEGPGILVDCGMFQGEECSSGGASQEFPQIEFSIGHIRALVVTHVHLDHVGRIPYLLAAGYEGPVYCSQPSAVLLPLVLEDACKNGLTRDPELLERFVSRLKEIIVAVPYGHWMDIETDSPVGLSFRLNPAGHILGSAYVECRLRSFRHHPDRMPDDFDAQRELRILFSGDLGTPDAPLLRPPLQPARADVLVLESTYGDRFHEGRRDRCLRLRRIIETALQDRGVILIPAFSIGRTQEILYDLEDIIYRNRERYAAADLPWGDLEIILDSPLANRYTQIYRDLHAFWDQEAAGRLKAGRHPLSFEQLTVVGRHEDHLAAVDYLRRKGRPCVVVAASGMCSGGRIVNYLKALLEDVRTDIVFVGYQARGTPGWSIQHYGPGGGYVVLDGRHFDIRARIHTLTGYSAHADQGSLVEFVRGMRDRPKEVRLVHGERTARVALVSALGEAMGASCRILF